MSAAAQKQLSDATTTIKKSEMELKHNEKILNDKQGKKRTSDASYTRDKQQQEQLEQKLVHVKVSSVVDRAVIRRA